MNEVKMTRRVTFSSGHRYWDLDASAEENRERYGRWASPYNHGHNYVLDVTVAGPVDPAHGMVVNIKRIDDVVRAEIVEPFDGRSLNDEVPHFRNLAPSLENLLMYIRDVLSALELPGPVRLTHLRLEEMPTLFAELDLTKTAMNLSLTRTYEFAASHRLHSEALSQEENLRLFGKCNNPAGHGHNYVLEVTVAGEPDPATGMLASLEEIDAAVNVRVVDRYDHRNLNVDLPEFAGKNTTSEVVAQEIFRALDGHLPAKLARVRLYETARNVFEVEAER